ncbi:hypothetical protein [Thermoactinospora rubra]|uniref:hypothetical protein n=1 Tax=Thermoactinospora rubra TaxID=1088767 RepID=UPI000A0F735F|nr:hypothetical protein [Thermoactinospora rubra]
MNNVGPGLLGFVVVALIGVALYFLIKSMNKQMARIEVPHEADLAKAEEAGQAAKTDAKPEAKTDTTKDAEKDQGAS